MILYRGVNSKMFDEIKDYKFIQPKSYEFGIVFQHDGTIKHDGSATYGKSEKNAILGHQIDSSKFKTSGISTTPFINRAREYALHSGKFNKGYILSFDTHKLDTNEYEVLVVSTRVIFPTKPEDDERILIRKDNANIPFEIVCKVLEI